MPTLTEKVKALEIARATVARLSREIVFDLGSNGGLSIATVASLDSSNPTPKKRRKMRTTVTEAMRLRVLEGTKNKISQEALAAEIGIAKTTVQRILREAKKKPAPVRARVITPQPAPQPAIKRTPKETYAEVVRLTKAGKSAKEIAKLLKAAKSTVSYHRTAAHKNKEL